MQLEYLKIIFFLHIAVLQENEFSLVHQSLFVMRNNNPCSFYGSMYEIEVMKEEELSSCLLLHMQSV